MWAESYTGMVRRCRPDGSGIEDIGMLPGDQPVADGLAVAADGRLFVTTVNGGGIDVLNADGTYDQFIKAGTIPTNCVFDGTRLLMTDAGAIADTRRRLVHRAAVGDRDRRRRAARRWTGERSARQEERP